MTSLLQLEVKVAKNRRFLYARENLKTVLIVGAYVRSTVRNSLRKNITGPVEVL